ncbi:hypothetical protein [Mycoplana ramosa]|uniref:Uncharacterized protein n=1 Tax=Mycoplana ramosa TaxID=40837 RepID=A0ABW3YPA8_MYCRA
MSGLAIRPRTWVLLAAGAGLSLLALANAHMIYVAVVSEPDCVAHLKSESVTPGEYRAAGSAC